MMRRGRSPTRAPDALEHPSEAFGFYAPPHFGQISWWSSYRGFSGTRPRGHGFGAGLIADVVDVVVVDPQVIDRLDCSLQTVEVELVDDTVILVITQHLLGVLAAQHRTEEQPILDGIDACRGTSGLWRLFGRPCRNEVERDSELVPLARIGFPHRLDRGMMGQHQVMSGDEGGSRIPHAGSVFTSAMTQEG
jgi:hypothetical protein